MKGYSPKLPLSLDPRDGFRLTRTLKEVTSQNLKMLVLTSPGERVMEPAFGVGLYNFLFELEIESTRTRLRERVFEQVGKYMPFVEITGISFSPTEGPEYGPNSLGVTIRYAIPSLGESDILEIQAK
tara:strand:+ start:650 stop:1030 length:381 start_codon:yes stop_codon:yes gene_type:complete